MHEVLVAIDQCEETHPMVVLMLLVLAVGVLACYQWRIRKHMDVMQRAVLVCLVECSALPTVVIQRHLAGPTPCASCYARVEHAIHALAAEGYITYCECLGAEVWAITELGRERVVARASRSLSDASIRTFSHTHRHAHSEKVS